MEKCLLCGQTFKIISWKHLFYKHNKMNFEEYEDKFDVKLVKSKGNFKKSVETMKKRYGLNWQSVIKPEKVWNKGLTKEIDPTIARMAHQRLGSGNPMHGKTPWNKGLTAETNETVAKIANLRRGKTYEEIFGNLEKVTKIKTNLSQRKKKFYENNPHPRKGIKHTEKVKAIIREKSIIQWSNSKGKVSKTQQNLYNVLKDIYSNVALEYGFHFYLIDIAFPKEKIAIECDGDFWHRNPTLYENSPFYPVQKKNLKNDRKKNSYLVKRGWRIIRFWNSEIEEDINKILLKIKDAVDERKI